MEFQNWKTRLNLFSTRIFLFLFLICFFLFIHFLCMLLDSTSLALFSFFYDLIRILSSPCILFQFSFLSFSTYWIFHFTCIIMIPNALSISLSFTNLKPLLVVKCNFNFQYIPFDSNVRYIYSHPFCCWHSKLFTKCRKYEDWGFAVW